MYDREIVNRRLHAVAKSLKTKIVRFSAGEIAGWVDHLNSLKTEEGTLKRDLNAEEQAFVTNERLVSKFDFRHFAENYCFMHRDGAVGGGFGTARLWESQEIILGRLAELELAAFEANAKGLPTYGIRVAVHKSRQLGATQLARELLLHRHLLWRNHRSLSASLDEDKVGELWDRDKDIIGNLPFFLLPSMDKAKGEFFENVRERMNFVTLASRLNYQMATQTTGLGQGRQFELGHLTECASWPYAESMIELDFIPTLPLSPWTLSILESTAQGRGNWWHEWTEGVRRGEEPGWNYIFIPWYAEGRKYRANPPGDWKPSPQALAHAELVKRTSPEFCRGKTVELSREQLYWWETGFETARRKGTLNFFLTNYCGTPEQGFQHATKAAFSYETIEWLRAGLKQGEPYELRFDGQGSPPS